MLVHSSYVLGTFEEFGNAVGPCNKYREFQTRSRLPSSLSSIQAREGLWSSRRGWSSKGGGFNAGEVSGFPFNADFSESFWFAWVRPFLLCSGFTLTKNSAAGIEGLFIPSPDMPRATEGPAIENRLSCCLTVRVLYITSELDVCPHLRISTSALSAMQTT
jgi:hypothetical protein